MLNNFKKSALLAIVIVAVTSTYATSASARLINQNSQGHGIKCFAVPTTKADGTIVYQNVCRKVGI